MTPNGSDRDQVQIIDEIDPQKAEDLKILINRAIALRNAMSTTAKANTPGGRLPLSLLTLASRRLPEKRREVLVDEEWLPELQYILTKQEELRPVRWLHAVRYALGLIWCARRVTREFDEATSPSRDGQSELLYIDSIRTLDNADRSLYRLIGQDGIRLQVTGEQLGISDDSMVALHAKGKPLVFDNEMAKRVRRMLDEDSP